MTSRPPILLVGEAQGEEESRLGVGFVGTSGAELLRMLSEAQVITLDPRDRRLLNTYYSTKDPHHTAAIWNRHAHEVRRTNVFQQRPPRNDLAWFCGPKSDALPGYPPLMGSKYVRAEFEPELDRLVTEILDLDPNLVVCLGGTPLWALAGRTHITKWRGTTLLSTHTVTGYKLLASYHPAAVLYMYPWRPTVIADLMKANYQADFPDLRRPHREIWIEPTIDDIKRFVSGIPPGATLSVDIETSGTRITCIGIAPSPELALVVPFDDPRAKDGNYWPTKQDERTVWRIISSLLVDPTFPKVFHNGLYDIAFLKRSVGIGVRGAEHDTMLLCHSLQPESLKALGYCGSLWSQECAWKNLGERRKTIKRDD